MKNDQTNISIGKILKQARTDKNWSLDELRSHMAKPKAKSSLMRYENGEVDLPVTTLEGICDSLGIDMYKVLDNINPDGSIKDTEHLYVTLPVGFTNKQYQSTLRNAVSSMPESFVFNYSQLSDFHKQMLAELAQTYSKEDIK